MPRKVLRQALPENEHIEARNALIPEAEAYANEIAGAKGPSKEKDGGKALDDWRNKWNLLFHGKMEQLVKCPTCGKNKLY